MTDPQLSVNGMHFATSEELLAYASEKSQRKAVLSFSCGKDTLGCWLAMRPYFDVIVPVYLYLVPELDFVEQSLKYYERVLQTRILRLPHPSLIRQLNSLLWQAPQYCHIIEAFQLDGYLEEYSYDDCFNIAKMLYDFPLTTLGATGLRVTDNLNRRAQIKRFGALNTKRGIFYPIFDWSLNYLLDRISQAGLELPVDYHMFGRSFDGLHYQYLEPIQKYFPQDYARILEFFPLAEVELKRREYKEHYFARTQA